MQFDVGMGRTGIGDNFARARLLLAKRAGYLPQDFALLPGAGNASAQWRSASKNLAADARRAGAANPLQWLREGAAKGGLQRPNKRAVGTNPLAYANSLGASLRTFLSEAALQPPLDPQVALLNLLRQRGM